MHIEKKLADLGFNLDDELPATAGNYIRAKAAGDLLFVAGHGPYQGGKLAVTGRLGQDLTVEDGYRAARITAVACLVSVRDALGDLDRVTNVVKVLGMVNCTEGFLSPPAVINGCSDLLVELYGDAGKHARSAVGMQQLPNNIPVEIEMILQFR